MMLKDNGRVGVTLSFGDWQALLDAAPELEQLGYASIWISGGQLDSLDRVLAVVRATSRVPVGTGIIPAAKYSSDEVAASYTRIEAEHPGRFMVGLGGAHTPKPRQTLSEYLDRLDGVIPEHRRMLAALGPRMLTLAAERTAGTFPLLVTPDYVATARDLLGPAATLVVQHPVVLDTDADRARGTANRLLGQLGGVPGYRAHFQRMGFSDAEIDDGDPRFVDALAGWGAPETIAARIGEHLDAGADQVAITVLQAEEGAAAPLPEWRRLAAAVL